MAALQIKLMAHTFIQGKLGLAFTLTLSGKSQNFFFSKINSDNTVNVLHSIFFLEVTEV